MQCGSGGQARRLGPAHSARMDAAPVWDGRPDAAFVQAGASQRDARVAGLGLRWNIALPAAPAGWGGAIEVTAGRWSTRVTPGGVPRAGREQTLHLVAMPVLRWRLQGDGASWFMEAGAGLSWHERPYRVERKRQGSRLNFQEELGLGHAWAGGQELSLRLAHMSNADLRKPNPGETWWSLRWAYAF